jgi:GLPGLI family protein
MKYSILLFYFSLCFYGLSSINYNSGEISYTVSFNNTSNNHKSAKLNLLLKNSADVEYKLVFNNHISRYEKVESMKNDSQKSLNITEVEAGGDNTFYFENLTKENLYSKKLGDGIYMISQKAYNWKLTKESKLINNYNCYKAIILDSDNKETDIIAWYTPEIPLGYGPKNYNGLPGLILQLNTQKGIYLVSKIKLSEKEIKIKLPKDGIRLTYEDYRKRFEGFFKRD